MAGEWNGGRPEPPEPEAQSPDVLERQAREAMAQIRARFGDLGSRVRRVVERAGEHWEASAPAPGYGNPEVPITAGERARVLARRWADIDFLVDPDLASGIAVHGLEETAQWRVELRERGETRFLEERSAPYRGAEPPQQEAARAVWDYTFPATPDIEAGDRRERVPGAGSVLACDVCDGSGRRRCRTCEGAGRQVCARCRGSGHLPCPRCRGRGRLARPRAGTSPANLHMEWLAKEAGERVVDLRDRLSHDWSKSFRSAFEWTPAAAEGDDSVPCPDCLEGKVPCDCEAGSRACATCGGVGTEECARCKGSGRLVRYREVVRRFDTRMGMRTLPLEERAAAWVPQEALARGQGEQVWAGTLEVARATSQAPAGVPSGVWSEALAFTALGDGALGGTPAPAEGERRVISRRIALIRVPLTHLDYEFARRHYTVTAYGVAGQERFWADAFPHRWSRVGRFLRAVSRDLGEVSAEPPNETSGGRLSTLNEFRLKRADSSGGSEGSTAPDE